MRPARIPLQRLKVEDADAFLNYLFRDVAEKPAPLLFREGAAVARYLAALAIEVWEGPEARLLDRLSKAIWGTVFRVAPLKISPKRVAIRFLKTHGRTYLAGFEVERAIECVEQTEAPTQREATFRPPHLVSRSLSASGEGNPYLGSDLSERIYAAYYGLRGAGIPNARGRTAAALNQAGLRIEARQGRSEHWEGYSVYGRVKQFETSLKKRLRKLHAEGQFTRHRNGLVDKWIYLFLNPM